MQNDVTRPAQTNNNKPSKYIPDILHGDHYQKKALALAVSDPHVIKVWFQNMRLFGSRNIFTCQIITTFVFSHWRTGLNKTDVTVLDLFE